MQSELDIVKYRELFEQSDILESSRDAFFVDFNGTLSGQLFSI